ncbi:LytR/AlgR family response regulator transcription factor [Pedobacter jamesrossensis]|uniref:LytR/AlgR family response regulator transcription factor n=1 Tax=Pedobacter jamesrossensis TaxID=1908238 RepID=A0ABV8NKD1_9SPHI
MKYKCSIIDDESITIDYIEELIELFPNLELTSTFVDPLKALDKLDKNNQIDILFMDIEMGPISGLDIFPRMRKIAKNIVIVTGHSQYALNAFELNADDFLLKPFNETKFKNVINKILLQANIQGIKEPDEFFYIKGANKNNFIKLCTSGVIAIEGSKNYIDLHIQNRVYTTYLTLKEISEAFSKWPKFMRVHKSFLINTDYIIKVEANTIIMENNLVIPLADSYRSELYSFISNNMLLSKRV